MEATVEVKNGPGKSAAFHHIESEAEEAVVRETLVGKGSTRECNEV